MVEVDSPRAPPQLGPAVKSGSLQLDFDIRPTTTVNILETYSPFPSFGNTRDPFGLDNFLLHPADVPWEYLRSSPITGDALLVPGDKPQKKESSNRLSMLRRPSPLASNPPLSADIDEADEEEHTSGDSTPDKPRPLSTSVSGKGLRALIRKNSKNPLLTPESDSPDTMPSTPEDEGVSNDAPLNPPDRRSMYSLSGSSSEDSYDGPHTPTGGSSPTDVTARLTAALQADQQRQEERKSNRTSWRDWLGGRRTSFLGLRGGESGTTLLESPRASVIDLIPEAGEDDVTVPPQIAESDLARSAVQLRRLSLIKLGSLRMPSPHPLAQVLARQSAQLPNEVAFAIPTGRRVYPKSVNSVQNLELSYGQCGGLRVALGLRGVIQRIDAGERPPELLSVQKRKSASRQNTRRARGVRDFVARRPFEERTVVYYPDDWCEEVSMARPGYGVWDLDFSDYIVALAETEDKPPRNYAVRPRPVSQAPQLTAAPVAKVAKVEPTRQPLKAAAKAPAVVSKPPPKSPAARSSMPSPAARASLPPTSFRSRTKPTTWDDSSDEEEEGHSESEAAKVSAPIRPPTTRNQSAPAVVPAASAAPAPAPAPARQSRMIDPNAALQLVTASRDRRHEANLNHVQRKAVTDQRRVSTMIMEEKDKNRRSSNGYAKSVHDMRRPAASKRVSSMTLSADAHAASLNKRASSQTLAATATGQSRSPAATSKEQRTPPDTPTRNRPAASLPSSPRLQSSDRRRVVSQYEPPALNHRASMMSLNMYGHPVVPMPAVPTIASPYMMAPMAAPMMPQRTSMMFPMGPAMPSPMAPHAYAPQYAPQFAHGGAPQMYLQPPPPNTGRRRERPVA